MSAIGLPDFTNPPVVETVLGVSFLEVPQLTSTQIVRFWSQYLVSELPDDEERAPYNVPVERFPPLPPDGGFSVRMHTEPPSPRFLFSSGNRLAQIQSDWFAYNWRKTTARPDYERYEAGRARFASYLAQFRDFLLGELEATLQPVQCEITYVNHVTVPGLVSGEGPLGTVLRDVQPGGGEYLPQPHFAEFASRYDVQADGVRGRLHVSARTAVDHESDAPRVVLTLTVRGAPDSDDISGVLRFLDCGREWIVRGFTDLTTTQMHKRWGHKSRGACT